MNTPVEFVLLYKLRVGVLCLAGWLAACGGPIVARSPEALYARAQEQIANGRYVPALDSLDRAAEKTPDSPAGVRAQLLRLALLGGLTWAYQDIAQSYLEGHQRAGEAPHAPRMRSTAMDYFGRVRGLGTDLVEALDAGEQEYLAAPVRLNFVPPQAEGSGATLDRLREGNWLEDEERARAERERVEQGLTDMLRRLSGNRPLGPDTEFEPAAVALGTARHLLDLTAAFAPEALDDPRMYRHFHQRALTAAALAAEMGREAGNFLWEGQAKEIERLCRRVLGQR